MNNLDKDLKNMQFKRVYLLYGEENYLKKEYETKFKNSILDKNNYMMNLDIFEGKINDVNTILKNTDLFVSGQKDISELIAKSIPEIAISTVVLFIENNIDKRNKLYKEINKFGYISNLEKPTEKYLINWVIDICNKNNREIKVDTAIKFLNTISSNMENIKLELNKLIYYKDEGEEITIDDISLLCSKTLEAKIFELVDAIGYKNCKKALDEYNNLILLKEQPIVIFSMIARQFRLMLQCKNLSKKGMSEQEIANELGTRNFIVKSILKQSKNFKFNKIMDALNDCLEIDIGIKTGKITNQILNLELFIIKYAK